MPVFRMVTAAGFLGQGFFAYGWGILSPEDAGGKASMLDTIKKRFIGKLPGIVVPDAFVIKTLTFREVLKSDLSQLQGALAAGTLDQNWEVLHDLLQKTHEGLMAGNDRGQLPLQVLRDLEGFAQDHPASKFAVRSSAVMEDSGASSCAGLFDSKLNVSPDSLETAIKHVWASAFTPEAGWRQIFCSDVSNVWQVFFGFACLAQYSPRVPNNLNAHV